MAVWQAYIDESVDDDMIVIGGFLATAENWAAFSTEWRELLAYSVMQPDGSYRFKMSEMAMNPERMERAQAFFRIIAKHVQCGITVSMRLEDFANAAKRLAVIDHPTGIKRIEGPLYSNPYLFTFYQLMMSFHENRNIMTSILPVDQKVDFLFDERGEKKRILESWEAFREGTPASELYGATPRFEDDDEFFPLQAADFLCWWMRGWDKEGLAYCSSLFPWARREGFPVLQGTSTEDGIFRAMKIRLEQVMPATARVYDAKMFVKARLASRLDLYEGFARGPFGALSAFRIGNPRKASGSGIPSSSMSAHS